MINTLRLQNFKCFGDQTFQMKPLTILTGLNGTGKSSVIQSLLLLRQSDTTGMLQRGLLSLKGELVNIGTSTDALFENAKEDAISFSLKGYVPDRNIPWHNMGDVLTITVEKTWLFKHNKNLDTLEIEKIKIDYGDYSTEQIEGELNDDNPDDFIDVTYLDLFTDRFHYLQSERVSPRLFFETSDFHVQQREQLGTKGEYAVHFLSVHGDKDIPNERLIHKDAQSRSLRHQVEAWLGEVSPGVRIVLDPNLSMDVVGIRYNFATAKSVSNAYRATNVGFGITYALPILVAVLSAQPDTLLIIENPEAHLHPKGQSQMGRLLALAASSGDVQIIVETHSDHVLNGIRLAVHDGQVPSENVQLHYFRRDEQDGHSEVVSPHIDRNGRIDQWPDGFFDEWDKSLEALLEPRGE